MKNYKITIMETRVATYDIQADCLTDAKDIAKATLLEPTIHERTEPQYTYTYIPKEITKVVPLDVKWFSTDRWIAVW